MLQISWLDVSFCVRIVVYLHAFLAYNDVQEYQYYDIIIMHTLKYVNTAKLHDFYCAAWNADAV